MTEEELHALKEISHKLDQLIILMKLSNLSRLQEIKKQLERDRIASRISEYTGSPISYSDLSARVSRDLGIAEITVKKKISTLKEMGILFTSRIGREVYYESSGLLD